MLAKDNKSSLLRTFANYACKLFMTLGSRPNVIKLFKAVIYDMAPNKLDCLSLTDISALV